MDWRHIWEKFRRFRYPALILTLGTILLLLPTGGREAEVEHTEAAESSGTGGFDLDKFTREAETLLSEIQGAGPVRILLTLEDDGRREYLVERKEAHGQDTEQTETGAVLQRRSGDDLPVTVTESRPGFRGAAVVCPGGDSPGVALAIKEALSNLTGLGMDRITVIKSA
ncbi:MAG: hypothetical protein IJ206_13220 [Oscillospiraceae bacterium]|nr:hypothetical protein [Oscillospiraceae bacterium]